MEDRMFGVRIMSDGEVADVKMFETLSAARELFQKGWAQTYDGYFDSIAIFDVVDTSDVREAALAIRNGDKNQAFLVDMRESRDITIAKLAKKITVGL
jgi:hypothetical protein